MSDTAKGVVVTTDNEAYIAEFPLPLYKSCRTVLGGWIETVHPRGLERPLMMLVNEEGLLLGLPANPAGCHLYGTQEHGWPIVGNVIFMKDGYRNGEPDIVGLDDEEVELVLGQLLALGVTPRRVGHEAHG